MENDASNNSSLPRERVYRAIALERKKDTERDPHTLLCYHADRREKYASNDTLLFRVFFVVA
jgi:hypothetical protein